MPRSNPLDPKLLFASVVFGCIWDRSVALRYSVENGTNCCNKCKSSSHKVALEFFCNKSTLSTPGFGAFQSVWVHLGPFRYCMKLGAKWVEVVQLIQKFVSRSRVRCFYNERTQSTPLDPKLTFLCVSYYLGAFGTVWLPYKTLCKTGRTSAKVRATNLRRSFSQRMHPIHPIGPKTHVLFCFVVFGCIRVYSVALRYSVQNGPNCCN